MKRQLSLLGLAALMLTACSGGGSSFAGEQQNIIYKEGSTTSYLTGSLVLNIASKSEVDNAYDQLVKEMKEKPTGDLAKAYWYDTARLVGKDLGCYKYDEGDTSFDLSIDIINGELAKYLKPATTEDPYPDVSTLIDDAYLQLYFVSPSSKYKTFDNSKCNFTLRSCWTQNGVKRNENLDVSFYSSIKGNTNIPLVNGGIKKAFGSVVLRSDNEYPSRVSEYRIKLSGNYEANYKDN